MRVPQLFLDLDGVLANFDDGYRELFGALPDRNGPEPPDFWDKISGHGSFFASLQPMPDAMELWSAAHELHPKPIILTGVPKEVPDAGIQKRAWVTHHFGADAHVITCPSAHKRKHGKPGDVLVDDWPKYQHLWEKMGGIFVLHTSAADSISTLRGLFK